MKITYIKTGKRMKENKRRNIFFKQKGEDENMQQKLINNYIKTINGEEGQKSNDRNKIKKHKLANQHIETNNKNDKVKQENSKNEKGDFVKTILKKNQIVILTLALMLITAGYMNYNNSMKDLNMPLAELGDAKLVSTNVYEDEKETDKVKDNDNKNKEENKTEANNIKHNNTDAEKNETKETVSNNQNASNETDENNTNATNNGESKETSNKIENSGDYFTQTRLDRDAMYSQMLETYQKILENEKIPADQKAIASNEIKNINDRKNAISIVENLIKTKGFQDVAILLNDNSINVVVKQDTNLKEEQVAQITNIVSRELKAEIGDIHISVRK